MKRPILIAVIGYIIGIIWGIYEKSIFPFWFIIIAIYYLIKKCFSSKRKFKILSIKRYIRYIKLYLNKTNLNFIILVSLISNTIVNHYNNKYEKFYNINEDVQIVAIVISNKIEQDYSDKYTVKLKDTNIFLYLYANKNVTLEYGDEILVKGTYQKPETQRNYKGFDYSKYLKSKNIYGTIKSDTIKIISNDKENQILKYAYKFNNYLKNKVLENMQNDTKDIFLGLVLGDTKNIDDSIIENFRTSNISHVLAISGMHISYIIMGVNIIFNKLFGYRKSKFITIIFVILYMFIVGFTPSIVRASIMGILSILATIIHRKSDTLNNIGFSALILLIYNPFIIYDLGFQLSYAGTISIILFNKNIFRMLKTIKNKDKKRILDNKLGESISVILSAQILILILVLINNNIFGIYFIITNLLTSIIIGPIILLGLIYIIILIINTKIATFIGILLNFLINVLISISNFSSLPLAKIYVPTPNFIGICIYFIIIIFFQSLYYIYKSKKITQTIIRFRNTIALLKYKIKPKLKNIKLILILVLVFFITYCYIPKNLKIYFVDVGQGDCTFIITPRNKTILIDGGGIINSEFDVGKSTVIPYILDRGYTKIDYLFVSHFDYDDSMLYA